MEPPKYQPKYQVVVFTHPEMPMFLGHETPSGTITRLARTKFGFEHADFAPAAPAHCAGLDKGKYVFEVQVTAAAAHKLKMEAHPDVMLICDPLPPRDFGFGARDPKELKKRGGPKL
ncbi:MAG: hypothetical protein ACAH80_09860 [Alphaproteobacteria bacterium]